MKWRTGLTAGEQPLRRGLDLAAGPHLATPGERSEDRSQGLRNRHQLPAESDEGLPVLLNDVASAESGDARNGLGVEDDEGADDAIGQVEGSS